MSIKIYLIREFLNGALIPLSFNLALIIAVFLINTRRLYGKSWREQPGVSTACALFWVFLANALRAQAAFMSLRNGIALPANPTTGMSFAIDMLYLAAAIIILPTILWCIKLFTPMEWGNKVWIASAIETAAFVAFMKYLQINGIM